MAKTHPHVSNPTESQLAELVAARPQGVREAYLAAHRLMLATVPGIGFAVDTVDAGIGYAAHQYGYNGWGMAALTPHSAWASLLFLAGSELPDPAGRLLGTRAMRHLKLRNEAEVHRLADDLRGFIRAAVRCHENVP